jgi:UDP-N-acetylglucosamine--N-acetylmuramyl-(pentapeptide) pyrophosphoryl-undecaprenol N-acetylglucosamine transferase
VWGGSQGSGAINDAILANLPQLLEKYQVVHQTGNCKYKDITGRARIIAWVSPIAERYKAFGYLNDLAMRMAAGAASLVISRAGAGSIFEIASWGIPSILIPIPEPMSHDQTKNAFSYARTGAAVVIEQNNLTPRLSSLKLIAF